MASIFDFLGGMSPEQNQGLLAAAAQVLRNSGPGRPYTLGQGLGDAIGTYQGNMEYQKQRKVKDQFQALELEEAQLGVQDRKRARDVRQQIEEAARGSYLTAGQQAASLPGGPTVENAKRIGEFKDGFDMEAFLGKMDAIDPLKAMEYRRMFAKSGPKYDAGITWVNGPDGKPMAVRTADDGSFKALGGLAPREKLEFRDAGNAVLGLDQYTGQALAKLGKGVSPDAALSAQTTRRGQNMTDTRQREMVALHRQIGKAPTEFQGKSAAFGLRATEADKAIASLTGQYDPAAVNVKTSLEGWPLVGGMLGAAVNKFALSSSDQKAEQAKRDFINAVLRQESGAAIGASEFDNADKQYFPQPGDGPDVIAQKARNRQLAIQGLQSNAGRAAMTAPTAAGGGITFLGFE